MGSHAENRHRDILAVRYRKFDPWGPCFGADRAGLGALQAMSDRFHPGAKAELTLSVDDAAIIEPCPGYDG